MRTWWMLVAVLAASGRTLGAQDTISTSTGSQPGTTGAPAAEVRLRFPPPRVAVTVGVGGLLHAGRPYDFTDERYKYTQFKPGPVARADVAVRIIGPLAVRAGIAQARPRWQTRSDGCGECVYPGVAGLHTMQLTFFDVGARLSVWRSETWPPEDAYLEYRVGQVRQRLISNPSRAVPGAQVTNGTQALGLGGTYALPWQLALTLHLDDEFTRYTPVDFAQTTRRVSQTFLMTAGLTWRSF